ncbi:hypothetical protein DFO83_102108 [Idiomarina loihiensis]|uniref:CBASS cGAMP synthase n=1 Tax=Idiomarina TaxID=135575 RepID=UPI000D71026B|nr:hypothetical protein [Idiomarina]PWW40290.1 hypothetical protein DFO83_102108 [Idiomarina loihiensis]TDP49981.1 hypothetical protein DET58_102104 [Idiomarina loihiensis]TDS24667.1 hypothetical protein DET62_102276 [Idiomarina sp. H2]
MNWNFHRYYTDGTNGLMGKLKLSEQENEKLKRLRQIVRQRTKDVFEDAKTIAKEVKQQNLTEEAVLYKFQGTKMRFLSEPEQKKVAHLIHELDDTARDVFINLTPRFWTQGSFQYNTLNKPFQAPQEMDIDDGTYMPMPVFETEPMIGHILLVLLVDASLKSLAAENPGWTFEEKQTCGRIKIPNENTHIDVPMYAIPKEQFLQKQVAMESMAANRGGALDEATRESYKIDSESVNLALRSGDKKWMNSDPKIVEDWFNESCRRNGSHLRKVSRFMKAWRDAQWDVGGPSSISLMAAVVKILDQVPLDYNDLSETMKVIAEHLPNEFRCGVESPDHTDDNLLFPKSGQHEPRDWAIIDKLEQLHGILKSAEEANSKAEALAIINTAFGNRVTDNTLITSASAAPALKEDPSAAKEPASISNTMVSG